MAAEPWIDHGDPEYWHEIIEKDLMLVKAVANAHQYFIAGLKCCEVAEKALCCWFIINHPAYELPVSGGDLVTFAQEMGAGDVLNPETKQYLSLLNEFRIASTNPEQKARFAKELSHERFETIFTETEKFYATLC